MYSEEKLLVCLESHFWSIVQQRQSQEHLLAQITSSMGKHEDQYMLIRGNMRSCGGSKNTGMRSSDAGIGYACVVQEWRCWVQEIRMEQLSGKQSDMYELTPKQMEVIIPAERARQRLGINKGG